MSEQNIKCCKKCGSTENKFRIHSHVCTKCLSKINNVKLNEKKFYKEYYEKNKEAMKLKAQENYMKKKLEKLEKKV